MINGSTRIAGIIGKPLAHSLSPLIHNYSFELLQMNWVYIPFPIPSCEALEAAINGLKVLGCEGLNVTAPYKSAVIPYLDELSETAKMLGAVNTIIFQKEENKIALKGENTDLFGFSNSLIEEGIDLSKVQYPIIIGAGGAARSVLGALTYAGCSNACIINRSTDKAQELKRHFEPYFKNIDIYPLDQRIITETIQHADLLIHTTPTGTFPHVEESIISDDIPLTSHISVVDLVYNPRETKLLKQAKSFGARAIGGLGMLYHQAALAFEYWTGKKMPLEKVKEKLIEMMK